MKTAKTTIKELSAEEAAPAIAKARKVIAQMAQWRNEGRCPFCGELGKFIGCVPVCSHHGPYSLKVEAEREFDGGDPPDEE